MDNHLYKLALSPNDQAWPEMIQTTEIPGILIYERQSFSDERGFFHEVVEMRDLEKALGKTISGVQWNHARSHPRVIRGFHAEPWEKLIYVVKGKVMAVFVDFRADSPTFGKTLKINLDSQSRKAIYLPLGIGNSYCNIGDDDVEYMYLVTDYYANKPTPSVNLQDPVLTRQFGGWPVINPIISEKDKQNPLFKEKFAIEIDLSKFPWLKEE